LIRDIARGLSIEEAPETRDILFQLAQDKITAIAPQISLVGNLSRRQQASSAIVAAGEQGPVAIFAIFVWIAQEEFA